MNRIVKQETLINVDSLTVHRLLLASLIVAAKFLDDTVASNRTWAYAGGLSVKELNSLEIRFLELISFDLYVELSDFECTKARLAKIADEKARFAGVGFDKALAAESAMCESCAYSPSPSFLCNFRDTICFHDPTP